MPELLIYAGGLCWIPTNITGSEQWGETLFFLITNKLMVISLLQTSPASSSVDATLSGMFARNLFLLLLLLFLPHPHHLFLSYYNSSFCKKMSVEEKKSRRRRHRCGRDTRKSIANQNGKSTKVIPPIRWANSLRSACDDVSASVCVCVCDCVCLFVCVCLIICFVYDVYMSEGYAWMSILTYAHALSLPCTSLMIKPVAHLSVLCACVMRVLHV